MIPLTNEEFQLDVEIQEQATKTYKMNLVDMKIEGMIDGLEAMKQAVYKILNTERYDHLIYSWEYGVEFVGLFGESPSFAFPEIKRSIIEALIQDERITNVDEFTFKSTKGAVNVTFVVNTTEGNIEIEKGVNL